MPENRKIFVVFFKTLIAKFLFAANLAECREISSLKQTQVGVCKRHKEAANTFANCWRQIETCLPTVFMPFTHAHQLEFANFSLPCEGRFTILITLQQKRKPRLVRFPMKFISFLLCEYLVTCANGTDLAIFFARVHLYALY